MMKKITLFFVLVFTCQSTVFTQEIHSPAEVLKILEKSEVSYVLNPLEQELKPIDRSGNLNTNHVFRKEEKETIVSYRYEINEEAQNYSLKAEDYFKKGKTGLAREMYLKVLEEEPEYFKVMTYIGQTYGIEKDFDKAIKWYKKSIKLNFIDYMAHWFLADAYIKEGKLEDAVKEITIAMILNRNNPRIKKSLEVIYELKKLETPEWVFLPQVKLDSIGPNEVNVSYGGDWLGYALVKALWKHEPGYRQSMGVGKEGLSTLEEREALGGLIVLFDKKMLKKNSMYQALRNAIDNKMVNEFIFYEIILPEYPMVAYQLTEAFIGEIGEYVVKIRGKKK